MQIKDRKQIMDDRWERGDGGEEIRDRREEMGKDGGGPAREGKHWGRGEGTLFGLLFKPVVVIGDGVGMAPGAVRHDHMAIRG